MLVRVAVRFVAVINLCCLLFVESAFGRTVLSVDIAASDIIQIPLKNISLETLQQAQIQASLDNYDISSLISFDQSGLYFRLSGALEAGTYQLRIVLVNQDGSSRLLFNSTLVLTKSEWESRVELRSSGTYQVDKGDDEFSNAVKRLSDSALRLQAKRLGGNTVVTSSAEFQHRSDANTLSGENLELGNFQLGVVRKTSLGDFGLGIGNQLLEQQSLVFNGFERRGIRAHFLDAESRYRVNTFYINTDPSVSYKDNLLVASDKRERSFGAVVDFSVFEQMPDRLRISGGYIDGQTELDGTGIGYNTGFFESDAEVIAYGGESGYIAAESIWLDQSLVLRVEQARSHFDSDGFGVGKDEVSDSASQYLVKINNSGALAKSFIGMQLNTWELSWLRQTVGENFYSLANIDLPGDLQTDQLSLQLGWSRVQLSGTYYQVKNNVGNRADMATQTTTQSQLLINYSPEINVDKNWLGLFGQPAFSLQWSNAERSQEVEDAILVGYDLDDSTQEYQASATFQRKTISWSLQHTLTGYHNHAKQVLSGGYSVFEPSPNTKNRFTTLNVNYQPSTKLTLSPSLQWSGYQEAETENKQDSFNASLNATISMFQDRLGVSFNYNIAEQDSRFGSFFSQKYTSKMATFAISWDAVKAVANNAGLKVSLSQSWNEQVVSSQFSNSSYQVLIGLEWYWAGEGLQ